MFAPLETKLAASLVSGPSVCLCEEGKRVAWLKPTTFGNLLMNWCAHGERQCPGI